MIVPILLIATVIYLIVYLTIKFSRSRKDAENERETEAERHDRFRINSSTNAAPVIQRSVRQTYIISPVYTIEANREPVPYEADLTMPRTTTRSTESTNKAYDDDLPTYDQAIIFSKPIETLNEITPNVPTPLMSVAVR